MKCRGKKTDVSHAWSVPAGEPAPNPLSLKKLTASLLILLFAASPLDSAFAQEATPAELPPSLESASSTPSPEPIDASALDAALDSTPATGEPPEGTSSSPESSAPSEETTAPADGEAKPPAGDEPPMSLMDVPEGAPPVINPTFTYQSAAPRVDKTTGALVETIKLAVPPGRNGLQPDLALVYNSQRLEESSVGYGWEVNIPYIERINRRGTNNLYSDDYFYSSLSGELASTTSSGEYRARVEEGAFLKYTLSATSTGGQWVAYDKKGTKYTFGTSTLSRIQHPSDATKVFRWMLEEVRDTNNNYIKYEYSKDENQIYPSKIYYTGNGTTDGIFLVEFTRESRPDVITSYKTAFSVKTNYRISRIEAKVSGTWVRRYDLGYSAGTNGYRSLLSSITETGQDESGASTVALPATTFEYSSTSVSFTDYAGSTMEKVKGSITALADTDGNGLADENISYNDPVSGYDKNFIELNFNEGSISDSTTFNPPYYDEIWANTNSGPNGFVPQEKGTRFLDFNGDGLADVLRSFDTSTTTIKRIYWNTSTYYTGGGLQWTQSTSTVSLPLFAYDASPVYTLGLFANLNGDGLVDFEEAHSLGDTNGAYFGTGSSLGAATSNFSPITTLPYSGAGSDRDIRLADLNGDGLDDWVYNDSSTMKVCLNTGLAWDSACSSGFNLATTTVDANGYDKGVRFLDINGDVLLDWVRSYSMDNFTSCSSSCPAEKGTVNVVKLNTGSGWATSTISLPYYIATGRVESGQFMDEFTYNEMWDWSGDGAADVWKKKNAAGKQDMLKKITYATGGSTQVAYEPTAAQLGGNSQPKHNQLPMPVFVVSSITNNDSVANSETVSYAYDGGDFYFANPYDRKFAGFEIITETKADGAIKTYYYQGNVSSTTAGEFSDHYAKIGKLYREDALNATSSAVYRKTFYYWDHFNQGANRDFVFLASTTEETFDGDNDHKDKATTFGYATSTGNLYQRIDYGEVTGNSDGTFTDTGTDLASTTISYAASTSVNMTLPHTETTQDQSLNKVKESRFYYDSLTTLGSTTKGNLTKREDWKSGSSYASTTKAYSSYGLVTSETDPRAKTTAYTIDSNNLYVATSTNPLSQATGFQYDLSSGKVTSITDPSNRVAQYTLDPLDRITAEKQPDVTTPSTMITKTTYAYTDSGMPRRIQRTDNLTSATSTDLYSYFDGLGRKIQERKEADGTNTYAVKDWIFNSAARLSRETLPYFASSTSYATSTAGNGIATAYAYDPMGRISAAGTIVGTTTNAYDDWTTTTTDPLGKYKDFAKDAYGNLTTVVEHNAGASATTTYEYNRRNDLTKITDALSNIRNFTYDGLSRRLTAEDLHASGDATYGTWTYTYDDAGNLTQQVDPKSQTVNITYDDLSRPLTEDYTGAAGVEAYFGYDFCGADGKGKLCSATTTNTVSKFTYNSIGLVSSENRNLASTTYITSYDYDRLGNITQMTYPDNSQTQYLFSDAGLPKTIQYRVSTSTGWSNVVSAINYSPLEQQTYFAYANNTQTCNTYNQSELYRLSAKRTTAYGYSCAGMPSAPYATTSPNVVSQINLLQNLSYTYDAAGNITDMAETGLSGAGRRVQFTYDDLHRLSFASTTAASSTPYRYAYSYDALGNILTRTTGLVSAANSYSLDLETSSSQYASTSSNGGITGGAITLEAWAKFESFPGPNMAVVSQSAGGSTDVFYSILTNGSQIEARRGKQGVANLSAIWTTSVSTSTWYHLVLTYDSGTGDLKLYSAAPGSAHTLRATANGSGSGSSAIQPDAIVVGAHYDDTIGQYLDGMVDEVRVWSDVRTTAEMDTYAETQLSGDEANLAAYYKLNNNYTDSASGAHNLAAAGSPSFTATLPFTGGGGGTLATYGYAGTVYANPHAPTGINWGSGTTTLNYDNNGNLTSYGTTTFAFDYRNRITQAAASSTATSTFVYDTRNDRVKQTVGTAVTYYPNKYFSLASTTTGTAARATSTVYIYAGETLVATVDRVGTTTSPVISSLHPDSLSSTNIVTDSTGRLARSLDYYPFGAPRLSTSSLAIIEASSTTAVNPYSLDLERDSSQYASVANDLGITGGAITLEAWMKPESTPGGTYTIASQGDAGTDVQYALQYWDNGGTITLTAMRQRQNNSDDRADYSVTLTNGTWYHVVLTYDGTTLKLYTATVGGTHTQRASAAYSGNGTSGVTDNFYVGATDNGGVTYRFDGQIDDVRVYNTALSTSTMDSIFEQELTGTESNLVAYYKLNDSYGDSTANGYNLSGVNDPVFATTTPFGDGGGSGGSVNTTTYYYSYSTTTVPQKQFIGQYYDSTPQLSYLNARYYNGNNGQFLSQDPVFLGDPKGQKLRDPQALNSYSYANNNPIINKDPDGRQYFDVNGTFASPYFVGPSVNYYYVPGGNNRDPYITLGVGISKPGPSGSATYSSEGSPSRGWNISGSAFSHGVGAEISHDASGWSFAPGLGTRGFSLNIGYTLLASEWSYLFGGPFDYVTTPMLAFAPTPVGIQSSKTSMLGPQAQLSNSNYSSGSRSPALTYSNSGVSRYSTALTSASAYLSAASKAISAGNYAAASAYLSGASASLTNVSK